MTELLKPFYSPDSLNYKLFMSINHMHHPLLDPVMEACITLGSSWMVYWYAILLFLVSLFRREVMPLRYVWLYCVAVAIGMGIEETLKGIFQTPRPALAIGREQIMVLGEVKLRNGLPSGHAVFSFLTASFLSYRRPALWKVLLFGFALLVGWSRMYVGAHFPLDVAGGAFLGIATALSVWKLYDFGKRHLVKEEPGIKEKEEPS